MRQSLPLMHFYSGKLLQFYSGVDTRTISPVARHIERVESGFRELSATTPIRSPKSVPDTVFPIARVPSSHSPSRARRD